MNIKDAAHKLGHEYPGGAGQLAARMGMKHAVFNSKINPNTLTHHLTLAEALRMQQLSGRADILHAMAFEMGYVCFPAANHEGVSDQALLDLFTNLLCELGEFTKEFQKSFADGRITKKELTKIKDEFYELQAAGAELLNRIESLADQA